MKVETIFSKFQNKIRNYWLGCFAERITVNSSGFGIKFEHLINCSFKFIFCDPETCNNLIIMPFGEFFKIEVKNCMCRFSLKVAIYPAFQSEVKGTP